MLAAGALIFVVCLGAYIATAAHDSAHHWRMIDLQVYRWAGEMARQHRNVYDLKYRGFLSFTYTPLALLVFEPLSPFRVGALRFIITGASIAALLGALWVAWGLAGVTRPEARAGLALGVAGLALGLEPVAQTLGFGQINLLLTFLILVDLAQPDVRRWKGAGVGLAAAIKLTPAIFVGYLVLTRRLRAAAVACATFAATVALGFLALPAASRRFWFGGLFLNSERVGGVAYAGNQSVNGALVRLFGGVSQARPAWFAVALLIGSGGLLLAAWASRRGEELLGIVTCALTALLISPISWSHHWVWVVLLVPCGVRLLRGPGRIRPLEGGPGPAPNRIGGRIGGWIGLVGLMALFLAGPVQLIWRPPHTGSLEYGWHGAQLIAGNLYVLLGLLLLAMTAAFLGFRRLRPNP
ncbi:MAG TPA: glycosyltransferase 87 family protein [Actinomycetota bacterium]